ncbi:MAG: hypothetical protein ACREMD_09975 [Gemmatimonadota bacterium]
MRYRIPYARPGRVRAPGLLLFCLPLVALATPAAAQNVRAVTPAAETLLVRQAAFALWWPHYERLMREFIHNTPDDAGRIALPEPTPDDFFREIIILGRILNPAVGDVSLYSVTTEGDLYQGLFVMTENDRAWPLVNRMEPGSFNHVMNRGYVDALNALLDRERVEPTSADEALRLARFVIEAFYNFDYRYTSSSVDSITFAELNVVRVLNSIDEIPQGLRRFDAEEGDALLYGKIPDTVRGTVTPPRVQRAGIDDYRVSFYTWHPQTGELKRWEIRLTDGQFVSLVDQTVEKWASFTVQDF